MMLALFHKPLIHCILAWTEIALSTLLTIKKKKKNLQKSAMIHMQALQSCDRTCKLQAIENLA